MWRTKQFDQSIVVLGAGFAGIECAKHLQKKLGRRAGVHVALVDKENHAVFHPLLPEVAAASIATHHVVNPIRMLARHVDFDCADVDHIDFEAQKVYFKSPEGMELAPMPYTQLVVAMGLVPNMGIIAGMAAHGLAMKTVGDAFYLRNQIITRLEMAANTGDAALRKELMTVVTVGAGFSGVETCAELHDMMLSALKFYPELKGERVRSVLVSSTDRILPALSPALSEKALKILRKRDVEILLKVRTTSVTPRSCFLNNGDEIPCRTVVSTVGNSPHPVVLKTPLEKNRGRLAVDEFMRCKGRDNVWAIGDCAWVINAIDGEPSAPTAQFAVRQGLQCANNIIRAIDGEPLQPFAFKQIGYLASLGHMSAVVEIGFVRLSGFIAWWVWRSIYLMKLPGWYRKFRVCIDWTIDLLFPRDICQLQAARSERVGRQHYEPGQTIVKQGDKGDTFFSIVNGECEVLKTFASGEEKMVARLSAGSYFGEEALLTGAPRSASVRAKTAVDVLCLAETDFADLTDNIKSLATTFKQTRTPLLDVEATDKPMVRTALARIAVRDRMDTAPVTVRSDASIEDLCRTFQQHPCDVFPVVGSGDGLVGMLTRHDLHESLNGGLDPKKATAKDVLGSRELVTALPDDDLCMTTDRFHKHDIDCMPVVDPAKPSQVLGIISMRELLQARIEIELVIQNPETAKTLKLSDQLLDSIHAQP